MVPGSKNQTSSDCGIPLPASKPKIWSLADTAACKTPPPIVQSQHGPWMTNPYHHSHSHPHSTHNPHSHQSGDLNSMMMMGMNFSIFKCTFFENSILDERITKIIICDKLVDSLKKEKKKER